MIAFEWLAGPAVVNVYINYEKKFAFVECRTGALQFMLAILCLFLYVYGSAVAVRHTGGV